VESSYGKPYGFVPLALLRGLRPLHRPNWTPSHLAPPVLGFPSLKTQQFGAACEPGVGRSGRFSIHSMPTKHCDGVSCAGQVECPLTLTRWQPVMSDPLAPCPSVATATEWGVSLENEYVAITHPSSPWGRGGRGYDMMGLFARKREQTPIRTNSPKRNPGREQLKKGSPRC
jgi:hypothetical protein